ncbi:LPXTG cell wall anchor domain-containing protein [Cellulosimicrobium cellulans]|uniref:LPXTG cell wall anchor domain-containing protein n=1 Tax=Cellulosimicrobium cellulans TaxID=1710 RepID=UPI0008490670|nr:LPXTG cell wall anchor domain-containing protein [Cellulosimicrobium cellulans]
MGVLVAGLVGAPATAEELEAPGATESAEAPVTSEGVDASETAEGVKAPEATQGEPAALPEGATAPAPSDDGTATTTPQEAATGAEPGPEPGTATLAAEPVLEIDRTTFTNADRANGFLFTGTGYTPGADMVFWIPSGGDDWADAYHEVPVGGDGTFSFHFVPGTIDGDDSALRPDEYRVWVEERLAPMEYRTVGWFTLELVTPVVEVDRTTFTDADRSDGFVLTGSGFAPGARVLIDLAYTGVDLSTMHYDVTAGDDGTFTFRFVPGGPHPEHPEDQPSQYILFVRQVVAGIAQPVDWVYLDRVTPEEPAPVPAPIPAPGLSPAPVASLTASTPGTTATPSAKPISEARSSGGLAETGSDGTVVLVALALVLAGGALLALRRHVATASR